MGRIGALPIRKKTRARGKVGENMSKYLITLEIESPTDPSIWNFYDFLNLDEDEDLLNYDVKECE